MSIPARRVRSHSEEAAMAEYILLLRESPESFQGMSAEQMQQIIQRYEAWRNSLVARGWNTAGKKLRDGAGRVMKGRGASMRVSDGPYAEAREVIGGFFQFDA